MTPRLSVTGVRFATADDLTRIADIEAEVDAQLASSIGTSGQAPPPTGAARAARPGWILTMGEPAVAFAHVLDLGGRFHLEQLAVRPDAQGHGIGQSLLRSVLGTVLDAGGDTVTLMTSVGASGNGPWYARHGFTELIATSDSRRYDALAPLPDTETQLGLGHGGRRITMTRSLADEPEPVPAVSVIPVHEGADGLEVFVQNRALTMDFVPGMVVFPGGRVDPVDAASGRELARDGDLAPFLEAHVHAWQDTPYRRLGEDPEHAAAVLMATAVREIAEETGAVIDPADLVPWDEWITPIGMGRRFDAYFHLLVVRERNQWRHRTTEAIWSEWRSVADVVRRTETGELTMVPPTRTITDELAALRTLPAVSSRRPRVATIRHDILREPRPR